MNRVQGMVRIHWHMCAIVALLCAAGWAFLGVSTAWGTDKGGMTLSVETSRTVLPPGTPQTVIAKVALNAAKAPKDASRPPVNLSIVLDRSGSMAGDKIEKAKEAAIEALKRLSAGDVFSLIVYDHQVEAIVPAQRVTDVEGIVAKIRRIQSGGRTALFAGVTQGAAEARKHIEDKLVHRIILLSDGLANVGPSTPDELGRLGAALLKEGISVTTVGVGLDYNEDLMTKLSQKSDGNAYFVESSKDLPRIFAAELGDVLSVAARRVHVLIECLSRAKPVGIIGREGKIIGSAIEITLNQLYGGQEKYALVELEVPGGTPGAALEPLAVTVTYEDPVKGRTEVLSGKAKVAFSDDKSLQERSLNVAVQAAYEMVLSALAKERAIMLADKGQTGEAAEELRRSMKRLKEFGTKHDQKEIVREAENTGAEADRINKTGWTNKQRKFLRTDSHNINNQQQRSR